MTHRIAVTGVNGFVGQHTARSLRAAGHQVIGVGRDAAQAGELDGVLDDYVCADLTAEWPAMPKLTAIIHLAGLAAVGDSFVRPQEYISTNSSMVTNMCEQILRGDDRPRIVGISSGAVYAAVEGLPLDESAPVAPSSPYVVSKLLVEVQFDYYSRRGLDCVIARPFNHLGPGQAIGFLAPDLLSGLRASLSATEPMLVGDLSTSRDYTDVRDVARAYEMLATAPRPAHRIYNVSSGVSVSGVQLLEVLADELHQALPPLSIDERRLRPSDARSIVGDSQRLRHELGWRPRFSLQQSLSDLVASSS